MLSVDIVYERIRASGRFDDRFEFLVVGTEVLMRYYGCVILTISTGPNCVNCSLVCCSGTFEYACSADIAEKIFGIVEFHYPWAFEDRVTQDHYIHKTLATLDNYDQFYAQVAPNAYKILPITYDVVHDQIYVGRFPITTGFARVVFMRLENDHSTADSTPPSKALTRDELANKYFTMRKEIDEKYNALSHFALYWSDAGVVIDGWYGKISLDFITEKIDAIRSLLPQPIYEEILSEMFPARGRQ